MRLKSLALPLLALVLAQPAVAAPAAETLKGTTALSGLLPVHVDKNAGKILLSLPAPGPDGVSGRFLYSTGLRSGVGSAPLGLDRAMNGPTQLLAFRRIGQKVAIQFENPRFRATGASTAEQAAARDSFAFTTAWIGKLESVTADGRLLVDISDFLTSDVIGIANALTAGGAKGFKLADKLSAADAASVKVFPDNIEIDALQTYVSDTPGDEISNIVPDPRQMSLTVHHSFVRLPDAGYKPRRFDPRAGGFSSQAIDFAVPLGGEIVYDLANRFRLEKVDPSAARSRVKKPIVFYIDRSAPEPIRTALAEGVAWWSQAFDAAGLIDAFQVRILPEDADPLDVRYNVVNWVNRATRGWSYGQVIADPRTGEIVKGSVLLGSLRVRQDMLIFEGLVGTANTNSGGPNDPARVALARLRQLGAHEVGHALGFAHNFSASTQDRASVMDYPAPRIGLVNGAPDLSDAYGVGTGAWDRFVVDWLYGTDSDADAKAKAKARAASNLRYISDADARAIATSHPQASLWDDGPDPTAELTRMIGVRRAAVSRFGLASLKPDEPVANLRRKLVPIWLLHRYQVEAVGKLLGGVDFAYSVNGDGKERSLPVDGARQRAALASLLATLSPAELRVPDALLPLLSAGREGSYDRQFEIEVFANAGGPVFDPLVAADVGAQQTLNSLLTPTRLTRVFEQNRRDPSNLGVGELVDRLTGTTMATATDALGQRIAYRTLISIAQARLDPATAPGVAAILEDRLVQAGTKLAAMKGEGGAWGRSLARLLGNRDALDKLLAEKAREPKIPPGMPIGGAEADWMEMPL